jgi:U3 small nucleolar RNA-associated protein 7
VQGTVSMWTPNMPGPAAKLLVHRQPVRAVAVDRSGNYMATSATDRSLKIWDLRAYKCLHEYHVRKFP